MVAVLTPGSDVVPASVPAASVLTRSFGRVATAVHAESLMLNVRAVPGLSTSVAEICTG